MSPIESTEQDAPADATALTGGTGAAPGSNPPLDGGAARYAELAGRRCAARTWAAGHLVQLLIVLDVLLLFGLHGPVMLIAALLVTVTALLFVAIVFRVVAVIAAITGNPEIHVSAVEVDSIARTELPIYAILVPLYREADVAGHIVEALRDLRYPRRRLDIKLLLEADDKVTLRAVDHLTLGEEFDVMVLPPSYPRTKPKACNLGLGRARGEFVVIFDAEDRPEPDQLLKVVHAFRYAEPSAACIQAKLNYANARENFITRSFAIEYTVWFDFFLPGLQRIGAPIPLGGTSNHFRTSVLRPLGGWDPFNVTEDCDLGVRLAEGGHATAMIDSTTWEEANSRLGNWLRQRSRWVKGYLQTHLVHTKSLSQLIRSLGLRRSGLFLLTVGGNALIQLMCVVLGAGALVYAALLIGDLIAGRDLWTVIAGSRAEYRWAWKMLYLETGEHPVWSNVSVAGFVSSVLMLLANGLFVGLNLLACSRRGYRDLWPAALLSPLYWIMGSLAAWKGAYQLIRNAHYWEKTVHGLSNQTTSVDDASASR